MKFSIRNSSVNVAKSEVYEEIFNEKLFLCSDSAINTVV